MSPAKGGQHLHVARRVPALRLPPAAYEPAEARGWFWCIAFELRSDLGGGPLELHHECSRSLAIIALPQDMSLRGEHQR